MPNNNTQPPKYRAIEVTMWFEPANDFQEEVNLIALQAMVDAMEHAVKSRHQKNIFQVKINKINREV